MSLYYMPDPVLNSESNKQKFLPPRDSVVMGWEMGEREAKYVNIQ